MIYEDFVKKTRGMAVFGDDLFSLFPGSKGYWRLALNRWAKQGKVIRLKRGLYTLPEDVRKVSLSLRWLANALYSPSYLSLEYLLSWYELIPERVYAVTSVALNKTQTFQNSLGQFVYRHLKKELFWGFRAGRDEFQREVLMAFPEKALLDFIYLNAEWEPTLSFMEKNIRLQGLENLQKKRLKEFGLKFGSKKISAAVSFLLKQF